MTDFFEFEADFVESLRCIPMQVRFKLDTCGIKLKLNQWHQFTQPEREALVTLPCATAAEIATYRANLQDWVQQHTGMAASELPLDPAPAWLDDATIPASVVEKAQALNIAFLPQTWQTLTPLQRFVLIKLSRSGHENSNFLPALQEFGLL